MHFLFIKIKCFYPGFSKLLIVPFANFNKEMFTAVRKTKLSAQNKDHNK